MLLAASLPALVMAFVFFEHAILFRKTWMTATTGKRRTPPGQSVLIGFIALLIAAALIFLAVMRYKM